MKSVEFYNKLNAMYPSDNPSCCYVCQYYMDGELKVPDYCKLGKFDLDPNIDEDIERDPRCEL